MFTSNWTCFQFPPQHTHLFFFCHEYLGLAQCLLLKQCESHSLLWDHSKIKCSQIFPPAASPPVSSLPSRRNNLSPAMSCVSVYTGCSSLVDLGRPLATPPKEWSSTPVSRTCEGMSRQPKRKNRAGVLMLIIYHCLSSKATVTMSLKLHFLMKG